MTAWNPKTDPPFLPPLNPRISAAEYQAALGAKPKRRHKYGVSAPEQRTADGITFDSSAECKRYGELKLLERGGFIRRLELQPVYAVEVNGKPICKYIADFRYFEGGERVVEDVKGLQTPEFKLKRKLVEALYPGLKIRIVPT